MGLTKKVEQEELETRKIIGVGMPRNYNKRKLISENKIVAFEEIVETQDDLDIGITPKEKKKKLKAMEEVLLSTDDVHIQEVVEIGVVKEEPKLEEPLPLNEIVEIKVELDVLHENENLAMESSNQKEIIMPPNDVIELIRRMEVLLPANDSMSYKSRTEKLNWNDIVFSHYSVSDCKEMWAIILKKIRRYRLLKEVLQDARDFVLNPPKAKKKVYPGMPQKPASTYQIFYKKKQPILISETPGMDFGLISRQISQMFKNLSPEKKAKYEKLAAQLKAKYDEELQLFYESHPEVERPPEKTKKEKRVDIKPKKPRTPFLLYFDNQLINSADVDDNDIQEKNLFKEQCKEKWKQLSIKKKVLWITKAEQDVARYEEEVEQYTGSHPNFVPISIKHILTKDELALKDRFSGKPDKPSNSAYSLFSTNLLRSDEIKEINAKDRMNYIASQWKNCSEEEKNSYKIKANELIEQFKKDYEKYLESLPEDKKQLELLKNAPKKKVKLDSPEEAAKKKKERFSEKPDEPPFSAFPQNLLQSDEIKKMNAKDRMKHIASQWKNCSEEEKNNFSPEEAAKKKKERFSEKPDKPPFSAFSQNLLQSDEIKKINAKDRMKHIASQWKNCSEEEKNNYKIKDNELMEQFEKDYEKYLESLPEDKKQLELLKNALKKTVKLDSPEEATKKKKERFSGEPDIPPHSAYGLFSKNLLQSDEIKKMNVKNPMNYVSSQWKNCSEEDRNNYKMKVSELVAQYEKDYEQYWESLSEDMQLKLHKNTAQKPILRKRQRNK